MKKLFSVIEEIIKDPAFEREFQKWRISENERANNPDDGAGSGAPSERPENRDADKGHILAVKG